MKRKFAHLLMFRLKIDFVVGKNFLYKILIFINVSD